MFNSVILIEFYKSLSTNKFPCVKKFAGKIFIVGSTYICEQNFSCLKINTNKNRSSVTNKLESSDEDLKKQPPPLISKEL